MKWILAATCAAGMMMAATPQRATFTKDVAPILQKHCQQCHRPGEVAPMPLLNYSQARPWAKSIRNAVASKKMPPWFADPGHGQFQNDPSLSQKEIDAVISWVDGGALEGDPRDLPKPVQFEDGWNIGKPDKVLQLPVALPVPATGTLDIVYVVVQGNFKEDTWIQQAEVRPGNRALVHHVNAFLRTPQSSSMRSFAFGVPYAPPPVTEPPVNPQPASEVLADYVPGRLFKAWPVGEAKLIPAGSDLMLQIHYQTNGTAGSDQTKIGLVFAKEPPKKRVLSAVAKSWVFEIPAGAPNTEIHSSVEFATDVELISLQPHMHYRGKDYEYKAVYPSGESEILLRVPHWDFNWQLTYLLAQPKHMPKGTRIECTAHYDNSVNNPFNPDPKRTVTYGEQTWDEMMSGWMEVGIAPGAAINSIFALK